MMINYNLSRLEKLVYDGEVLDKKEFCKALIPIIAYNFGLPRKIYADENREVMIPIIDPPHFISGSYEKNSHFNPNYGYVHIDEHNKNHIDVYAEEIAHAFRFLAKVKNMPKEKLIITKELANGKNLTRINRKYSSERPEVSEFFGQLGREAAIENFSYEPKFSGMFSELVHTVPNATENLIDALTQPENLERIFETHLTANLAGVEKDFPKPKDVDRIVANGHKILEKMSKQEHTYGYTVGHIFYQKAKEKSPELWAQKPEDIIENYFKVKNILREVLK